MKLASYKDGSRDGHLVVVSRDLHLAVPANGIASRLQAVLDDWNFLAPQLQDLAHTLDHGKARHAFPFEPAMCLAPLPRAPRRLSPGATRHALVAGSADWALGPTQDLLLDPAAGPAVPTLRWAAVTGDIAARSGPDAALEGVRLLGLLVDWTLGGGQGADADPSAATATPSPAAVLTAWAPVLVTLDELDGAWQRGRLALQLERRRNAERAVRVDTQAGADPAGALGPLLATAARLRPVTAGTVLASGPLGPAPTPGSPSAAGDAWRDGDRLQVQALAADGHSVFGAIDQTLTTHD
jgi:fumarylacetoacetate (FAA) hydrolase